MCEAGSPASSTQALRSRRKGLSPSPLFLPRHSAKRSRPNDRGSNFGNRPETRVTPVKQTLFVQGPFWKRNHPVKLTGPGHTGTRTDMDDMMSDEFVMTSRSYPQSRRWAKLTRCIYGMLFRALACRQRSCLSGVDIACSMPRLPTIHRQSHLQRAMAQQFGSSY